MLCYVYFLSDFEGHPQWKGQGRNSVGGRLVSLAGAGSSPWLECFVDSSGDLEEVNTARLFTQTTDIYQAIVVLMGAYYVADVA